MKIVKIIIFFFRYLVPNKVSCFFFGDKIPAQQRAGLWLIAHESLVHAIIGYRSGCGALVTPQTGKVLKITFYGGKQNGFFKKI